MLQAQYNLKASDLMDEDDDEDDEASVLCSVFG